MNNIVVEDEVCFVILLFPYVSFADFSGPVVGSIDGATLKVLNNYRPERICRSGKDSPEKGQPFGMRAKHATSALAFGKDVALQNHGHDEYIRILGDVFLLDSMNLNQDS